MLLRSFSTSFGKRVHSTNNVKILKGNWLSLEQDAHHFDVWCRKCNAALKFRCECYAFLTLGTMWFDGNRHGLVSASQVDVICLFGPAIDDKYEKALVPDIVTSQTRQRPFQQGINVSPSCHLPSVLNKMAGSLIAGILARIKDRWIMSFRWLRRISFPVRLQDKVRDPLTSAKAVHRYIWGLHTSLPRRNFTAIQTVSPSRPRLMEDKGMAFS